jgi:hypothetical protein
MIISLDSFGLPRSSELKPIKQYIVEEAREKRQIDVSIDELHGVNAKGIPQQDNFYDCGVYLIAYMREFAKDPDRFVKRVLGREIDNSDFQEFDTSVMRKDIREKLLEYGNVEDRQYRDEKMARRGSAKKTAQTPQADRTIAASTQAADAEVEQPPISSQPAGDSHWVRKVNTRNNSPRARSTPPTSTEALCGSEPVEAPTSSTYPGKSYLAREQEIENEDDLELDVPHALPTPRKAAKSDDEMLMRDDIPDVDTGTRTPRGREVRTTRDPHLSPLSSLDKDVNGSPQKISVAGSRAGNTDPSSSGGPEVEIPQEDGSQERGSYQGGDV